MGRECDIGCQSVRGVIELAHNFIIHGTTEKNGISKLSEIQILVITLTHPLPPNAVHPNPNHHAQYNRSHAIHMSPAYQC